MFRRHSLIALALGALVIFSLFIGRERLTNAAQGPQTKADQPAPHYLYNGKELSEPRSQYELDWLMRMKKEQEEQARSYQVYHDFKFVDRFPESGITFKNIVTDDSKRNYKAAHYDHGNGIAVADVDGDGLYDIYFVTQMGCNELWRNVGGGKFENITEKAGVGMCGQVSVTASFADVDNDGRPDLFVTTVRHGNHLFHNDGGGKFTDITEQSGLSYSGHSSGATFVDYNRDGLLDLLVSNVGKYTGNQKGEGGYYMAFPDAFSGHLYPERTEPCILYKNLGNNRFQDVTKASGITNCGWNGDATFVDLKNNGYPSLYLTNMEGNNHFYENVDGDHFVDKTDQYFPKTPWGAMGIKFFDYNNDGLMDLYVTDMHSDMSHDLGYEDYAKEKEKSTIAWPDSFVVGHEKSIFGNAFYKNLGDGKFTEISDQLGLENYWPWGISVDDLNADGYQDIFVTAGMSYYFRYATNSLLLNDGGKKFLNSEFILGVEPRRDNKTVMPWFDVDCDGPDFTRNECKGRDGKYTVLSSISTRSSVIFDLDGDGDLDIVTNEFNYYPQVLISDLAQRRKISYLKVTLKGTKSNREGLGTKVVVSGGGLKVTKFMDGKSGYLSQSDLPLYFGLGDAKQIDSVEVFWPSGTHQTVPHASLNGTLEIEEGGKATEVPDKISVP
jgi:enediyne biosynthesis protein E4